MKEQNLFEACTISILGGVLLPTVYGPLAPIGYMLVAGGAVGSYICISGASKFGKIFKNLKLGINEEFPIFKGKKKTPISKIYKFTLPTGLCLKDFENFKDEFQQYLGRDVEFKYTYKQIQIEVFKQDMKHYYEYQSTVIDGDMPVLIGYNRKGEAVTCDLSSGEPHILIAGETGSGKSTTLRSLITNLILESEVKLHLIDLKMRR